MIIKTNDNKNVFISIVCEVNTTVCLFFYKYYKRLKRKLKTPQLTSIKTNQPKTQIKTPTSNLYLYNTQIKTPQVTYTYTIHK